MDYVGGAKTLGVKSRALKAVAIVESSGVTYWEIPKANVPDDVWEFAVATDNVINGIARLPPIRLEAHIFGSRTGHVYDGSHPKISSPSWNPALAAGSRIGAWLQFGQAAALNENAAIESCSLGQFQIMGFHWPTLKLANALEMLSMSMTSDGQLTQFIRFIQANPAIWTALRNEDWYAFENGYNGGGFHGQYAVKITNVYASLPDDDTLVVPPSTLTPPDVITHILRLGSHGDDVRVLQKALVKQGKNLNVDGDFGPITEMSVKAFQASKGLNADGMVGPLTGGALGIW